MEEKCFKEYFIDSLQTLLKLEWLGVRIEDVKEESQGVFYVTTKTVYYYSVPESSTIELDNKTSESLNDRIKSSDGLAALAKQCLIDMALKSCVTAYSDDKEFIEDIKNNPSEYLEDFKFCVRVRKGEVWSKEKGDNRLKELREDIRKACLHNDYEEI